MRSHRLSKVLILGLFICSSGIAANPNIIISGSIPGYVEINHNVNGDRLLAARSAPVYKKVLLEKVFLSPEAQSYLALHDYLPPQQNLFTANTSSLPANMLLGMNGVPVLDQGQHGACVTFADTAAIDAAYGRTDYISQLCNLELGSTLEMQNGKDAFGYPNYPSGWDGSTNEIVLDQIKQYGIITMSYQKQYGCAGVKDYPLLDENNRGNPMSESDFRQHDQDIMKDIYSKPLLSIDDAFSSRANMDSVLTNVKKAVFNGHRVVFAMLLDVNGSMAQYNGALGAYNGAAYDSWIMTPQIYSDKKAKKLNAGHAMVITGYDDNAEIIGPDNTRHKGVLILRNSWGADAGANGDYYMSYEYFKNLVMEAYEISPTPLN